VRHVVFTLERERYALPLGVVREVIDAPVSYTRVPLAPPCSKGVMNLRGRVVVVVDLKHVLTQNALAERGGQIVLLEMGRRDLGLLISHVEGIESIERVGPKGLARVGAVAMTVLDAHEIDQLVTADFANR
jgi:purine-binding chemotaxis protein CheW